jgi:hypothetical protein
MGIGVGVLLIVVGAIVAFAIDKDLDFVDSYVLGWILIIGGILARRHDQRCDRGDRERPPDLLGRPPPVCR